MAYLIGVLIVVLGLLVSIALHEVGHMVPAKRFGVRVSQYMVGFGPTLWSRRRGETEYGVKAFPLGGYVRLVGMYPPAPDGGRRIGRLADLAQSARDASAEEILPGEEHRAFYNLSAPKKLVVMFGGPVMNLAIAVVLVAVMASGLGVAGSSTTVGTVSQCVIPADAAEGRTCTADDPQAPAAAAGLLPGDRVVAFDGQDVATWSQLQEAIRGAGGRDVAMVLERDGELVTTTVHPLVEDRPVYDEDGAVVLDADGAMVTAAVGFLGISPTVELQRQPLTVVPGMVWDTLTATAGAIVTLPATMAEMVADTVGGDARDSDGVVGPVGITRFAGEIVSTQAEGFGLAERVASMLGLLASLNIALFAFNMVPLLPLDGGHIAGALWEGLRRQIATVRGQARPGPVDLARMMPLAYAVFVALLAMGAVLVYVDLVNPITLTG